MATGDFTFTSSAYIKMLLHALKYPHCSVSGLLLAHKAPGTTSAGKRYCITDSIPLFHHTTSLTPQLEFALAQVEVIAKTQGLEIAGYYHCNHNLDNRTPSQTALKVMEKVSAFFSDPILLIMDNWLISVDCERTVYRAFAYFAESHKLQLKDKHSVALEEEESSLSIASQAVEMKLYRELVDYENHLDDISCDYLNRKIQARLELIQ